jgi:hypothetical protein
MPKPALYDSWPVYKRLIGPLKARARSLGYCLAVHGTLRRDIDLLAVPWVADAAPAKKLAAALFRIIDRIVGLKGLKLQRTIQANRLYAAKRPHGRLAWAYRLQRRDWARLDLPTDAPLTRQQGLCDWYVDLSVMPTIAT